MSRKVVALLLIVLSVWSFREASKSTFEIPFGFPKPVYKFKNNPIDSNKVELGRYLFYDPILSLDSSISCASCHSPYNAFAHTDHQLSHGINDSIGTRNAPALFNLAWQKEMMWDGAANHIDMQALAPLSSKSEMGEELPNVLKKLRNQKFYKDAFQKAFNSDEITGEYFLKALAQFQLSLVSSNSKYDRVMKRKEVFSDQESKGYQLFQSNCNSCHTEPLFSSYKFENNYLEKDSILQDKGRGGITSLEEDNYSFKVPSLRNLKFTFPYMHDGRFVKLYEVLNHYTAASTQQSFDEAEGGIAIQLSENEKVDLIAFLLTLNDKEFVFQQKHQFPRILLTKSKE